MEMNAQRDRFLRDQLRPFTKRSNVLGYSAALLDVAVFVTAVCLACASANAWLQALFSVIAGTMISTLFVLAHDASHGSLVRHRRGNALLARLLLLPSLHNLTLWKIQHNRMHHQDSNIKGMNSWAPLSADEFAALPRWRQWRERLYRGGGFGPYYLVERWLKHKFYPGASVRGVARKRALMDFAALVVWLAVWSLGAVCAGSLAGNAWYASHAWGVVLPFALWNCLMGLTVYLQHTHPAVPWFRSTAEARRHGAEELTVHVRYPRWYGILSHDIMEHPAHHIHPLIPFYRLRAAQERLNELLGKDAIVEPMTPFYVLRLIRQCRAYDYERKAWVDFCDTAAPAPAAAERGVAPDLIPDGMEVA
jgi:omega-6 fatty acid desaturase (delta-12 desaturase)